MEKVELERLVDLYGVRVSNIIFRMLGRANDVDDLTQDVFVKVYRHIEGFGEKSSVSTWIYRITVNTVLDHIRKQRFRKTVPLDYVSETAAPAGKDSSKELALLLDEKIRELPPKYRLPLILKDIQDLSYKEIAHALNCRIGTVESRLFRARKLLKKRLEAEGWWRDFL